MALPTITVNVPELNATFRARLIAVRKSSKSSKSAASFVSVCPDCDEPNKVSQKLICNVNADHGPFANNEIAKAREVDKTLVPVTAEQIEAMKEPTLPTALLDLTVFRTEQVEAATRPDEKGYFLGVTDGSVAKMLHSLLTSHPDKALVGEMTLSGTQKMFRLSVWNESLFLQDLIRPEAIAEPAALGGSDFKEKLLAVYGELLDEAVEEFDPDQFKNQVAARVAEFDAGVGGTVAKPKAGKASNEATLADLEALLIEKRAAKKTKKEAA